VFIMYFYFFKIWRQLTRVQKFLVVFLSSAVLLFIYVFFYKTSVSSNISEIDNHPNLKPIKNPRKGKFDREKYMEQVHKMLDSKVRPLKRGPPRRSDPNAPSEKHFIEEKDSLRKHVGEIQVNDMKEREVKRVLEPPQNKNNRDFEEYNIVDGERDDVKKEKERLRNINALDKTTNLAHNPQNILQTPRQLEVINAMRHAWKGYKQYAWGHDELRPIRKSYAEWFMLGLTIVDSLDTLWLMNMKEEYKEARDWVEHELTFDKHVTVNLFETTIRVLGGLLSIFHLSADPMYLKKAVSKYCVLV